MVQELLLFVALLSPSSGVSTQAPNGPLVASAQTSSVAPTLNSCLGSCPKPALAQVNARDLAPGLIVESVVKGRQADKLGIRPGDLLLRWRRGNSTGEFNSPFELAHVSVEEASQGLITVYGLRRKKKLVCFFDSDSWGLQARPNFLGAYLAGYQEATRLSTEGNPVQAAKRLNSLADSSRNSGVSWLSSWLASRAARVLFRARLWESSDMAFQRAIDSSQNDRPEVKIEMSRMWASTLQYRGNLERAKQQLQDSLLEAEKAGSQSMEVANSLLLLASVDLTQDDLDQAEEHLTRALAIAMQFAPSSFQAAAILEYFGVLYQDRSDLEKAEGYYLKALRIEERHFSESRQMASALTNLGTLASARGDVNRSEAYHHRALIIAEKVEENAPQIADILNNLGECALERGDAAEAESLERRALVMRRQTNPNTLAVALNLASLGDIERVRHNFTGAEADYEQAMSIALTVKAPQPELARILTGEGDVFRDGQDYQQAESLYRRALEIVEKFNPGGIDHAEILAELAGILFHQSRFSEAASLYPQALNTIEARSFHLGGEEEDRSRYRAGYTHYYHGFIDVLLQQGRREEAFEVSEGSRARTLLEMLSRAHINIKQSDSAGLQDRERRLHLALQKKTEDRIGLVARQHNEDQLSRLDLEIEKLLIEEKEVKAQLEANSPRYVGLTEPRPLSTGEIQKLLDENTLLLEYSLGEDCSHLWILTIDSLRVYDLPKKSDIERSARVVYDLLAFPKVAKNQLRDRDRLNSEKLYQRAARQLSQMVLGPVARQLGKKRLLIVSDGVLQYIPFAALPIPERSGEPIPLIVEHEIVDLPSASILAEIRRQQSARPKVSGKIALFADPVFDVRDTRVETSLGHKKIGNSATTQISTDLTRSENDLGLHKNGNSYLPRLLYTRVEAKAVMSLIPPESGFQALDFDASRATAMSDLLARYRVIHFATHGLLNNKHPELTGLVFSLVNRQGMRQDGFLKLQDVYDLNLHADLVVLSGCETGLGEEINGEGLIGLTRGFFYAGTSRVVASLWSVSDSATASLMTAFYKAMEKSNMRPAEALRAAQIEMWTQPQWRSPYYWAAFQIHGEWR